MTSATNVLLSSVNNLDSTVELFYSKIELMNNLDYFDYVKLINKLIDSLIDVCVKNKITYFIKKNISFTSIKSNFKIQLEKMLLSITKKIYVYLDEHFDQIENNDFDNWNDLINIITSEPKIKNKVSFNPNATEYQYDEKHKNKKVTKKTKPVKILMDTNETKLISNEKIAICIKIIFSSKKNKQFINEFKKVINSLCLIIGDKDIDYDILNPYSNM